MFHWLLDTLIVFPIWESINLYLAWGSKRGLTYPEDGMVSEELTKIESKQR